jgi:hypothetical protein
MSNHRSLTRLKNAGVWAAFLVLAAWLALLAWLTAHTAIPDSEWARLLVVFGSIESVAFAAAGALFGTTIQGKRVQEAKQQVEKAEQQAAEERNAAKANAQAAVNGKALASAVKARAKSRSSDSGVERVSRGEAAGVDDELVALSNELFPD